MGKLKQAQEERRARQAAAGSSGNFFRVPEDGEETVRFLETLEEMETNAAYFHEMEPVPPKRKYTWFEICLDQDEDGNRIGAECPGCEANSEDWETCKRKLIVYANVIWRDAPVRKKGKDGKWEDTDEKKDQLAVWEIKQSTVQDALGEANVTYKSLTTRDFVIRRRGTGFDTSYSIQPVTNDEGESVKTPLSAEDKELIKGKADLATYIALKDIKDWGKPPVSKKEKDEKGGGSGGDGNRTNPFLKNKGKKAEPEADDSDDETTEEDDD